MTKRKLVWIFVMLGVFVFLYVALSTYSDLFPTKIGQIAKIVLATTSAFALFIGLFNDFRGFGQWLSGKDSPTSEITLSEKKRNRETMLQRVENNWIKGVLEQSLYGAVMLELGKKYHPEAVDYPWKRVVHKPNKIDEMIPSHKSILEVFDEESGELLILGEPGSGKTTMLLALAKGLIERARRDEIYPMPVVFNLSSWAKEKLPLEKWLINDLKSQYFIPKRIGNQWIQTNEILLLLDGLDEVEQDVREACVQAINRFRQDFGTTKIALCSRRAE